MAQQRAEAARQAAGLAGGHQRAERRAQGDAGERVARSRHGRGGQLEGQAARPDPAREGRPEHRQGDGASAGPTPRHRPTWPSGWSHSGKSRSAAPLSNSRRRGVQSSVPGPHPGHGFATVRAMLKRAQALFALALVAAAPAPIDADAFAWRTTPRRAACSLHPIGRDDAGGPFALSHGFRWQTRHSRPRLLSLPVPLRRRPGGRVQRHRTQRPPPGGLHLPGRHHRPGGNPARTLPMPAPPTGSKRRFLAHGRRALSHRPGRLARGDPASRGLPGAIRRYLQSSSCIPRGSSC